MSTIDETVAELMGRINEFGEMKFSEGWDNRSSNYDTADEHATNANQILLDLEAALRAALSQSGRDAEITLRRMLCLTFSRGFAYTDDGELSDSQRHPSIDFLRDAPADIESKIIQRNADTLTAPVQTVLTEHSGCGGNTQIDSLTVRLNPGDKVVLLKGRITQGFDRADAAIQSKDKHD